MFVPQDIIRRKRDREVLSQQDISKFVDAMAAGQLSEAQVAAFGMAVFLNGMSTEETAALTIAMRDTGRVLDWSHLPGPVADKHSTGGVGDLVSLVLAPILVACGVHVPMISGRGLGHTGGTLDKLEAIPGFETKIDTVKFSRIVEEVGCAIVSQSEDLVPADRIFYAVRDVTATVESIPLITASILSKKLAAGVGILTLDVKYGNGAFMQRQRDAVQLATSLVETAKASGLDATALVTDMNQPLANSAGNALEVLSAINFITGRREQARLREVVLALAAETLLSAGAASTLQDANVMSEQVLRDGRAAEIFAKMVVAQGGPGDLIDRPRDHLKLAPETLVVESPVDGLFYWTDTRAAGLAIVDLGAGRIRATDRVDHGVGLSEILPSGTRVEKGRPLFHVHARTPNACADAVSRLSSAWTILEKQTVATKLITRRIKPV